jgi:hypothetical protein
MRFAHLDKLFLSALERFDQRERARATAAFDKAIGGIIERLDAGDGLRGDGFFEPTESGETPSDAEQILEGVLRAASETHEARKAERLGELFTYLAFSAGIKPGHANYLLAIARGLTYQQLLLLGLFSRDDLKSLPDWEATGAFTHVEIGIVMEIYDLANEGLLVRRDHQEVRSFAQVNPSMMSTALNGTILVEAMSLLEAEPEDWDAITYVLQRLGKVDVDEAAGGKPVRVEAVVPPGSSPERQRVKIDKQVVSFDAPSIKLADLPSVE